MTPANNSWQRRSGIMLAYPLEEKRLRKWSLPYLVQPKFDGERCRAVPTPSGYLMLSSEENVIYGVPHIKSALDALWNHLQPNPPELDGELWAPDLPFEEIHSRVSRKTKLHNDHERVTYQVFDIADENVPQIERLTTLGALAKMFVGQIKMVETRTCITMKEIMNIYESFISAGYEGIIVRHVDAPYIRRRSIWMMKFKPKESDIYKIIGYKEEVSKDLVPKGRLGALLLTDPEGNIFSVGSGLTDEQRSKLWTCRETLEGKQCEIQYQHRTSHGAPRFTVFMRLID